MLGRTFVRGTTQFRLEDI